MIDSELRAYLDDQFGTIAGQFSAVNQQLAAVNQQFAAVDQRFQAIDRRFETMDRRLEEVRRESRDNHAETLRQFHVIEERLYDRMALLAEGHAGLVQRADGVEKKIDTVASELQGEMRAGFRLLHKEIRAPKRRR